MMQEVVEVWPCHRDEGDWHVSGRECRNFERDMFCCNSDQRLKDMKSCGGYQYG